MSLDNLFARHLNGISKIRRGIVKFRRARPPSRNGSSGRGVMTCIMTSGAPGVACAAVRVLFRAYAMRGSPGAVPLLRQTPPPQREAGGRIVCCVTSGEARYVIRTAVKLSGAQELSTTPTGLLSALRQAQPVTALIHDLAPWDISCVRQFERIRREYPDLPILFYAPARPGVAELLVRCARLSWLRAELQQSFCVQETHRVRDVLRSLREEEPRARLFRMIQTVAPGAPQRAWSFTQLALKNLRRCPPADRLTVVRLADRLGVSERTLERSWSRSVLPPPKEFLEWLTLLLVSLMAVSSGATVSRVARGLGIDSQRLYRLRLRLLPSHLRSVPTNFDTVFLAFAERCRTHAPTYARGSEHLAPSSSGTQKSGRRTRARYARNSA